MLKIDTSPVTYFSQRDEDHFFVQLQEIPCVTSIEGGFIHIDSANISEMDLRDILAVLYRLLGFFNGLLELDFSR
jgi:hypothetical protein